MNNIKYEEILAWIMDMVSIPSYPGIEKQETGVAIYIKSIFDKEGIKCELVEVEDGRCNVYAELESETKGKTLLLCGHMDTVEPYNMKDALKPVVVGDKLYGRGTSDMKGPVACMMAAMIDLKRSGTQFKGKVMFAGVCDEEMNSIGAIELLKSDIKVDAAIIGEPTDLDICLGHRGLEWYEFKFIGKTVHGGSQDKGINAIQKAVKFINHLEDDLIPFVNAKKHELLDKATLNYGVIQGGTQLSTVAGECILLVDRRFLPYESYEDVENEFKDLINKLSKEDEDFHCEMKVLDVSVMKPGYVHMPMEIDKDHELVKRLKEISPDSKLTFFPAWTDGGLLYSYGNIPTVVIGPGLIECCHSDSEYMPTEHIMRAATIYREAIIKYC
ncbi:MAG: M20 family metallopeptidase [Peptostreptococcaceae bacterium]|nr:M20 family metallopeptidase [Peptostreptococcaceae bacterium]